ncbi:MAG: sugar phosphate nucleotidyltransferase [Anaerovorax sp.]
MKIILLSGGSGKRLWPMSNDARSKQFLKILKNQEDEDESMVQRVYGQLQRVGLGDSVTIATSANQVDLIRAQLGEGVNVVLEPERRDTFPAIALACANLHSVQGVPRHEVVVVIPVDPFVDLAYFRKILELEPLVKDGGYDMALMGVKPTYPSEKYGYIIPQGIGVKEFKEKPDLQGAKALLKEGALWNCGVFAFQLGYILDLVEKQGHPSDYEKVYESYGSFHKISFDYEVVEKADNVAVIEFSGMWKDLGTWNTLTEHIENNVTGKALCSQSSTNTHVINELDIPVAVLGIKNAIVAVSPDGILVSDKHDSSYIKQYADQFVSRPMYEERRWGSYKVLDYVTKEDGQKILTKYIKMNTGKNVSYQIHKKRQEIWTIVSGRGDFLLDGNRQRVEAGQVVMIPKGAKHSIYSIENLEFIEVQLGEELIEEDIERLAYEWADILVYDKEVIDGR